jgi:hypothetical protein
MLLVQHFCLIKDERAQGGQAIPSNPEVLNSCSLNIFMAGTCSQKISASTRGILCTVTHNTPEVDHGLCSMNPSATRGEEIPPDGLVCNVQSKHEDLSSFD